MKISWLFTLTQDNQDANDFLSQAKKEIVILEEQKQFFLHLMKVN